MLEPRDRDATLDDATLDSMLRRALVVDPPPAVQAALLSSVLAEADRMIDHGAVQGSLLGLDAPGPRSSVGLAAYALAAILIAAYVAVVSGLNVDVVVEGAHTVAVVAGSPVRWLLVELAQEVSSYAVWVLLMPLIWYLWESDRRGQPA